MGSFIILLSTFWTLDSIKLSSSVNTDSASFLLIGI
jgi:hypothetical protein